MKRKLIFLDIDGTIVSRLRAPSARVIQAVCTARKNGHMVFLCTGRNMAIIGDDIKSVGFDGIVASAGAHVEAEGEVLFDSLLSEELVQECLGIFHANGLYCRIESPEGIYTDPQMEALLRAAKADETNSELIRMQRELEAGIHIQPYEKYPNHGAYKICFTSTTREAIEETRRLLGDRFSFAVHPYANGSVCLNGEIIPREVGKGRGMELICRHFGADLTDTIAFGDSMNDCEMMRAAGLAVAMENSCGELRRMADRVCESVGDDGVYHELRRLGII